MRKLRNIKNKKSIRKSCKTSS